jgi:hypothetical protein
LSAASLCSFTYVSSFSLQLYLHPLMFFVVMFFSNVLRFVYCLPVHVRIVNTPTELVAELLSITLGAKVRVSLE